MRGHWFWDFAFLNSNYHLEHHYFAGVPFYRLPALQRALAPFYERHRMRWQNYSGLIYGWLVENRAPHTNWAATRQNAHEVRDAADAGRAVRPARSRRFRRPRSERPLTCPGCASAPRAVSPSSISARSKAICARSRWSPDATELYVQTADGRAPSPKLRHYLIAVEGGAPAAATDSPSGPEPIGPSSPIGSRRASAR